MGDPNWHIETPRLYLSYAAPDDDSLCTFITELWESPKMNQASEGAGYIDRTFEVARQRLTDDLRIQNQAVTGFGTYVVTLKPPLPKSSISAETPFSEIVKDCVKIGMCTMKRRGHTGGSDVPDLGFAFAPQWHGKGYAAEASRALMNWLVEEKGVTDMFAYTSPTNEDSKKLLRRLGFEERGVKTLIGVTPNVFPAAIFALPSMDADLTKYGFRQ